LAIAVARQQAIELRKMDGGGRKLRTEPQRRQIFGLRVASAAEADVEISERYACLGSVGIEPLGGDEFGDRALEPLPISRRQACGRNFGDELDRPQAYAAYRIGKKRRHQPPELRGRYVSKHVERADPYHRVGIG